MSGKGSLVLVHHQLVVVQRLARLPGNGRFEERQKQNPIPELFRQRGRGTDSEKPLQLSLTCRVPGTRNLHAPTRLIQLTNEDDEIGHRRPCLAYNTGMVQLAVTETHYSPHAHQEENAAKTGGERWGCRGRWSSAHTRSSGQHSVPKTMESSRSKVRARIFASYLSHNGVVVGGGAHVARKGPLCGEVRFAR